jgi:uncharacterized protein with HEPN domain
MAKDHRVFIGHMRDTAEKITAKLAGKSRQDYDGDENLRLALAYLVQIIGEAARRVEEPFRDAHPEIPWRQIIGMRHFIVHNYMNVDEDRLWDTVTLDVPNLFKMLDSL